MIRTIQFTCLALAAFVPIGSAATRTQDPHKLKPEELHPNLTGESDDQKEMVELFHKVEKKLAEIDSILYDAGAGGATKGELKDAGIDKLLQAAQDRSKDAQSGIDRILEIARKQQQQQQQGGGSGQGQPKDQSGQSPLDKDRGDKPAEQDKKPGGKSPKSEDQKDQQDQKDGKGQRPKSNKESKEEPKNSLGVAPPSGAKEQLSKMADGERWGDLPIQVRDVFRVEGGGDLPPRYRDWIDAYYRRMNRHP